MVFKLKQLIEDWRRKYWYKKAVADLAEIGKSPKFLRKNQKSPKRGLLAKSDFDAYSPKENKPQFEL